MTTFLSILAAFVVLSVLVFVHELGHFIAGRLLGFKILEFSIGMGPQVLKKEKNGIVYSLRALPIGGMCKFYGEDEGDDDKDFFSSKPVWKRIIVVAAGPIMNVVFSVVFAVITVIGYGDILYRPAIAGLSEEITTAAEAGIMENDVLLEIDGVAIEGSCNYSVTIDSAIEAIKAADPEDDVTIVVDRGGEEVSLTASSLFDEASGQNMLGVSVGAAPVRVKYGFFESIGHSFKYIGNVISEYLSFFGRLFTGNVSTDDVGGTIMMIDLLQQAVRAGFETVLRMAVVLSLSLGLMNALPIPALDGGRLLFMLIELIFRKPVPAKVEGMIHFAGFVLLMILMVFLVYLDITKIAG